MREVTFLRWLTETCRVRHTHLQHRGRIARFVIQMEVLIRGEWQPVRRYDTAHGFAHCDIYHFDGQRDKVPLAFHDFNEAMTFAEADLRASWSLYVKHYLEEVEGRD